MDLLENVNAPRRRFLNLRHSLPSLEPPVDAVDFLRLLPGLRSLQARLSHIEMYKRLRHYSDAHSFNNRAMATIGCAEGPEYLY